MGYRIEYDRGNGKYEVAAAHPWRIPILLMGAFGMLWLFLIVFKPDGAEALRSALIPGEDAVTVQAFQNMTDDLRCGARVSDAVQAFCRYIIHGR